jgi:hypothetical protein
MGDTYLHDIVKTIQPKNYNMDCCKCPDTTELKMYKYALLCSIMKIYFIFNDCSRSEIDYIIEHFDDIEFCHYCRNFKNFSGRLHYIIDVCIQNKNHEDFPKNLKQEYFDTFFYFHCDFNEYINHWNKLYTDNTNGIREFDKCSSRMIKAEAEHYLEQKTPDDIGEEMTPEAFKEYIVVANQQEREDNQRIAKEHQENGTEPEPGSMSDFFASMDAHKSTRCDFCNRLYPLFTYESVQGWFFAGTVSISQKYDDPNVDVAYAGFGFGSRYDDCQYKFTNVDDARKGKYICDICASDMVIDGRLV